MMANRCIHHSYLVADPHFEFCIASGGRCYRAGDVWATQLAKVKCPRCAREFDAVWAYEAHYNAVHQRQ